MAELNEEVQLSNDEILLNSMNDGLPIHAAIQQGNLEQADLLLQKFLAFRAQGLINNDFLEKRDEAGHTAMSLYLHTKLGALAEAEPAAEDAKEKEEEQEVVALPKLDLTNDRLLRLFMIAGASVNTSADQKHLLEMVTERATENTTRQLMTFCGGRELVALGLQEAMMTIGQNGFINQARKGQHTQPQIIKGGKVLQGKKQLSADQIFQLSKKAMTPVKTCSAFSALVNDKSQTLLRALFNLSFCTPATENAQAAVTAHIRQQMTNVSDFWLAQECNVVELYADEMIDCIAQAGVYFKADSGLGAKVANLFKGSNKDMDAVAAVIKGAADAHQGTLQEKLEWIKSVISHKGIADNQHGNSLWRHMIRAIHERPFLQQFVKVADAEQHVKLCAEMGGEAYPACVLDVYGDTSGNENPFYHPSEQYRGFYHQYLSAWTAEQLAPFAALEQAEEEQVEAQEEEKTGLNK